jgi:hypothetical protein
VPLHSNTNQVTENKRYKFEYRKQNSNFKFYLTTLFTAGVLASNAAFDSNFWQLGINRIYVETDY